MSETKLTMKDFNLPPLVRETWEQHIDRGMAFLDTYLEAQDWVNNIDLDDLNLNDGDFCICGQLFGEHAQKLTVEKDLGYNMNGYEYALHHVIEHGAPEHGLDGAETYYGFYLPTVDPKDEFRGAETIAETLILTHNGYDPEETSLWALTDGATAWHFFTDLWKTKLEKRRAELGTI